VSSSLIILNRRRDSRDRSTDQNNIIEEAEEVKRLLYRSISVDELIAGRDIIDGVEPARIKGK